MNLLRSILIALLLVTSSFNDVNLNLSVKDRWLIENVTILSANKEGNIEKYVGYVLIDNDTIAYCGKLKPNVSGTLTVINGKGKFIIPGLIDSHVHLANVAGMSWEHQKKYPGLVKSYFEQLPKSYLYYGYTTLIDVNNYAPGIVKKIKNSPISPDIFTCGEQVLVMNDFMMEMDEMPIKERLMSPFLFDKYNPNILIPDSINLDLHTPKAIVDRITKQGGGIGAKIVYEDEASGFPKSWALPSLLLMKDLVHATKQAGIPLVMHATSLNAQKFGIEAGINIFAHPMWNWQKNHKQFLDMGFTKEHQDVLTKISTQKIGYQLTFRAIHGEVDLFENNFMATPALRNVYPSDYLSWLQTEEANWGKEKILSRAKIIKAANPDLYNFLRGQFASDEAMFKKIQQVFTARMKVVAKFLSDHQANLLFGTDGVAMNMSTNPPGYNGFLEMQHWVHAGVSLKKIFIAATYGNAKAFHLDNKYGTIEKGKYANLLLLTEDPLRSISAYDKIASVIVHGKVYDRKMLSSDPSK